MVYVMVSVSALVGFFFCTGILMNEGFESILYGTGVLLDKEIWGGILMVASLVELTGMVIHREWLIQLGAFGGFMAWSFACISLALAAHWYLLITFGLMHLLLHGYVYLASTLNVLHRVTRKG